MRSRFRTTLFLLGLGLVSAGPVACTSVLGAPSGDDAYEDVSANDAEEEELDQEVGADIDR